MAGSQKPYDESIVNGLVRYFFIVSFARCKLSIDGSNDCSKLLIAGDEGDLIRVFELYASNDKTKIL